MSRADDRAAINEVRVLVSFLRTVIDSDTLRSTQVEKLLRDVDAIPARFAAVQAADVRSRRSRKSVRREVNSMNTNHEGSAVEEQTEKPADQGSAEGAGQTEGEKGSEQKPAPEGD